MTSPCATCKHLRPPVRRFEETYLPTPAKTPAIAAERERARREDEVRLREEQAVVQGTSSAPLSGVPQFTPWCAQRSDLVAGRYFFTDNREGDCQWHEPTAGNAPRAVTAIASPAVHPQREAPQPAPARKASLNEALLGDTVVDVRRVDRGTDEQSEDFEIKPAVGVRPPAISGKGFTQSYLLFGGPGAGKTTFFKYLLQQVLEHDARPGCLLLDPKASLCEWFTKLEHPQPALVVSPSSTTGFNLFGLPGSIPPLELGTLLAEVVLAQAGDVGDGWQVLLNDLLQSAVVLLSSAQESSDPARARLVTPRVLVDELLGTQQTRGQTTGTLQRLPKIQVTATKAWRDPATEPSRREAAARIREYAKTEEKNKLFIRQLISNTLGALRDEEWRSLSDADGIDFYGSILEEGRRAIVAVGFSSPAFQRALTTIIKAVFQQHVLADLQARSSRNDFVVLACDEYAEIVTEGASGLVSDARFFSQAREAHCMSLLALQSIATGRSRFPASVRDRWDGIMGNVSGRLFMRLNDTATARAASDLVGRRQVVTRKTVLGIGPEGSTATDTYLSYERPEIPDWLFTSCLPTFHALAQGNFDGMSQLVTFVRCPPPS